MSEVGIGGGGWGVVSAAGNMTESANCVEWSRNER